MQAADGRLGSADLVLKGPQGRMQYRPLHAQLVGRRCRMACTLATVYSVGPQTGTLVASLYTSVCAFVPASTQLRDDTSI